MKVKDLLSTEVDHGGSELGPPSIDRTREKRCAENKATQMNVHIFLYGSQTSGTLSYYTC